MEKAQITSVTKEVSTVITPLLSMASSDMPAKAIELWGILVQGVANNDSAKDSLIAWVQNPRDDNARETFETQFKQLLAEDPNFVEELQQTLKGGKRRKKPAADAE